ncbi:MAG: outer membrane lipoprotein carrier protein LolA [Rhizobacter sp.]|jgi:hypothetical protein
MKRRTLLRAASLGLGLAGLRGMALGAAPAAKAPAGAAPSLLEQVRRRLADAPVLKGSFEQRKTVKGFRQPLVSRGDFLVARDRGVLWHTREPFASELVITRDRLLSRQAGGVVDTQVDAAREPGIRAVNEMLFALMAADFDVLAQRFHIDGALQGAAAWRLVLTPKDAALAQWVARIELDGDRFVRQVRLAEAGGDSSAIALSGQATATSLSREDGARFD